MQTLILTAISSSDSEREKEWSEILFLFFLWEFEVKYKIAVATSDGKMVDTHFGHASRFLILDVDEDTDSFEDVEERNIAAACAGGNCASVVPEHSGGASDSMDAAARALCDVDYVLVARIGPHALQALARYNVTAFDIVLSVSEAVKKINIYRKKIAQKKGEHSHGKNS